MPRSYDAPRAVQRTEPPYTRLMREHDLELLELPAVLARLAAAAASEPGALLAEALRPSADAGEVRLRQQQTTEAIALLDEAAEPDLGGARRRERGVRAGSPGQHARHAKPLADRANDPRRGGCDAVRSPSAATCRRSGAPATIEPSLLSVAEEIGRSVEEDGSDLKDSASAGAAPASPRAPRGAGQARRAAPQDRPRPRAGRASAGRLRDRARRPSGAGVEGVGPRTGARESCTTRPAPARRSSSSRSRRSTTRTGCARPRSPSATRWHGSCATSRRSSRRQADGADRHSFAQPPSSTSRSPAACSRAAGVEPS